MTGKNIVTDRTHALISAFFRRYDIRSMGITRGEGITKNTAVSDITMHMLKEADTPGEEIIVEFKLQRDGADIHQYLQAIDGETASDITLAPEAEKKDPAEVNEKLAGFLEAIRERVQSALKEERVQNITYVGNTFILNNSTKFKVLSDEGEGRLNIEVLTKDRPLDAKLTASGLLDGLYLGSIKLVES